MQNTGAQNKENRTVRAHNFCKAPLSRVKKPKSINELIRSGGNRLAGLKSKAQARSRALEHVRATLPPPLARTIVSAGLEQGQLTIGVASAAWATRLRYMTEMLRTQVGASMSVEIEKVRIRVVPPRA